jgi:hypothetical protein
MGSFRHLCCCNIATPVDLSCPAGSSCEGGYQSAGLWCGCMGFTPAASGRWGLCYIDPSFPATSQTDPGYLLTRYAEGQYRYEEAGVRKMEFDFGAVLGGNHTYTIRSYLWEDDAWVLKRTLGPTAFANEVTIGGYKAATFGFGGSFKLWAIDEWVPQTINIQLAGVTACSDCAGTVYYNGSPYETKTVGFNFTQGTLTRGSNTSDACRYTGTAGTVTLRLYDWGTGDCFNSTNLRHELTVPITFEVVLGRDRQIIVQAASTFIDGDFNSGLSILTGFDAGGVAVQFDRTGEVLAGVANDNDCDGFPVPHSDGGTATITIPAHGS